MDHIINNEGKPVPDLSTVSEVRNAGAGSGEPMDEDEDEDADALRAIYGKGASSSSATGAALEEAKVRLDSRIQCGVETGFLTSPTHSEHQVLPMWQDIQEYRTCQLSRREERARSI